MGVCCSVKGPTKPVIEPKLSVKYQINTKHLKRINAQLKAGHFASFTDKEVKELEKDMQCDKEVLKLKECNLINLALVLLNIYEQLDRTNDQDLILAVGNTGCGKSTMLSSLIFGPENLEIKKIPREVKVKRKG